MSCTSERVWSGGFHFGAQKLTQKNPGLYPIISNQASLVSSASLLSLVKKNCGLLNSHPPHPIKPEGIKLVMRWFSWFLCGNKTVETKHSKQCLGGDGAYKSGWCSWTHPGNSSCFQPIIPSMFEKQVACWWLSHPSEKYESQLGLFFPTYGKSKTCSKPPKMGGTPKSST